VQGCSAKKRGVGTRPKNLAILKWLRTHFKAKHEKVWESRSHAFRPHYHPWKHNSIDNHKLLVLLAWTKLSQLEVTWLEPIQSFKLTKNFSHLELMAWHGCYRWRNLCQNYAEHQIVARFVYGKDEKGCICTW